MQPAGSDCCAGAAAQRQPLQGGVQQTESESAYYASIGFVVAGAAKCFVLSSKIGTRYHSDADLHGAYRSWLPGVGAVDQWRVDSTGLARALNRGLKVPLIQLTPRTARFRPRRPICPKAERCTWRIDGR